VIVSRLQGGHSNQLFQYAVARRLADIHRTELLLDLTWFDDFADVDTPRFYELDNYPLRARTTKLEGLTVVDPRQPVSSYRKLMRRLGMGDDVWMYYEPGQGFDPEALRQPDNTLLVGFWQTEKYFRDIRGELIQDLALKTPLSKDDAALQERIDAKPTIAVHVRRGDYVTNKHARAFHGLLPKSYYAKAVDLIASKAKSKDMQVLVVSNDIAWCKENLKFKLPVLFAGADSTGAEHMRLMKRCRHFVMANSSFSWWGSWLSDHPGKLVVAPKVWFQDHATNSAIDIALDSWIRL
jgi:hypothetical protein